MSNLIVQSQLFGQTVRRIRCQKVWSQETLAQKASIKILTLRNIENGKSNPHFQTITKLAQAFGLSPEELIAASSSSADTVNESKVTRTAATINYSDTLDDNLRMMHPSERAFFGVKRITIALPLRNLPGRRFPVISSEDDRARRLLKELLLDLTFKVDTFNIPADGDWHPPAGDVIAICEPLNSQVTAEALASDPVLQFNKEEKTGLWTITNQNTGKRFISPMDEIQTTALPLNNCSDVAYISRVAFRGRTLFIISGIHAIDSVGAVHYLSTHLTELYSEVGTHRFSMVVTGEHNDRSIRLSRSSVILPGTSDFITS